MKSLHFGAGNIGRGFIGDLLHKSGYDITFVEVTDKISLMTNQIMIMQITCIFKVI